MGPTTVRLARVMARLAPCRPGIAYLQRTLQVSERTIQYHLAALRETGLLVYITRGGRFAQRGRRASEFDLAIPPSFDAELQIQTTGDGFTRRPLRIAPTTAARMGELARLARTPRRDKRASTKPRCTPIGVSTGTSLSAGWNPFPLERPHAGGNWSASPSARRQLNAVGQRFRLAFDLIQRVPWLHASAIPRVAWIVREVCDAGWTADEVIAWLNLAAPPLHACRPCGLLAYRLAGATRLWPTAAARQQAVEQDRERCAAHRHAMYNPGLPPPPSQRTRDQLLQSIGRGHAQHHHRLISTGADDPAAIATAAVKAFLGQA